MRKKLTKKELQKHLHDKTKEQLIEEIWALTRKYDFVKHHYEEEINYSEITKLLNKYKKTITDLFNSTGANNIPKIKEIFLVIDEYKQLVGQHESITDLFLHTLNQSVNYAKNIGEINDIVKDNLENVLVDTLTTMVKEQTYGKYKKEILDIVEDLSNYKTELSTMLSNIISSNKPVTKKRK